MVFWRIKWYRMEQMFKNCFLLKNTSFIFVALSLSIISFCLHQHLRSMLHHLNQRTWYSIRDCECVWLPDGQKVSCSSITSLLSMLNTRNLFLWLLPVPHFWNYFHWVWLQRFLVHDADTSMWFSGVDCTLCSWLTGWSLNSSLIRSDQYALCHFLLGIHKNYSIHEY